MDISEVKQGERCVLCIERHRAYRGEPKGSFPIAALSAPRFEATYLDLYVSSGESVSLRNRGSSCVHVVGALVDSGEAPDDDHGEASEEDPDLATHLAEEKDIYAEEAEEPHGQEGEGAYTGLVVPLHRPIDLSREERDIDSNSTQKVARHRPAGRKRARESGVEGGERRGQRRRH